MKRRIIFGTSLALAALLFAGGCHRDEGDASLRFYEEIHDIDRLTLSRMEISKMAVVEDQGFDEVTTPKEGVRAVINSMKIGDRTAAYRYSTYLEAYIDFSALRPEDISVDERERVVRVRLPEIQTRLAGRDATVEEVHYRVTGLRSAIGEKERAALKERMNRSLKQEIAGNRNLEIRLKEEGRIKAEEFIGSLAGEGWRLEIKD